MVKTTKSEKALRKNVPLCRLKLRGAFPDVVFTRQTDGSYELKCFLSVGPAGGGGIEPRLVQRFLSKFKKSPFYLLTTGYFPNTGHLPDEYILAWEGGFIVKNKVTVDGQVYYGQKP